LARKENFPSDVPGSPSYPFKTQYGSSKGRPPLLCRYEGIMSRDHPILLSWVCFFRGEKAHFYLKIFALLPLSVVDCAPFGAQPPSFQTTSLLPFLLFKEFERFPLKRPIRQRKKSFFDVSSRTSCHSSLSLPALPRTPASSDHCGDRLVRREAHLFSFVVRPQPSFGQRPTIPGKTDRQPPL